MTLNSVEMLQQFISNGSYFEMISTEKRIALLRQQIREYQESTGENRILWTKQGVIGLFERVRVFEEDAFLFKEYLKQLGLLPFTTKVKWSTLKPEEQEQIRFWTIHRPLSVKLNLPRTLGIEPNQEVNLVVNLSSSVNDKVLLWKQEKNRLMIFQHEWNLIKTQLVNILQLNERIDFEYGSMFCVPTQPVVRTIDIYRELGEGVLLERGHIDSEQLMNYMAKGFISKKDISVFRKIQDIQIRYILMELEAYNRRNENFQQRLLKYSLD